MSTIHSLNTSESLLNLRQDKSSSGGDAAAAAVAEGEVEKNTKGSSLTTTGSTTSIKTLASSNGNPYFAKTIRYLRRNLVADSSDKHRVPLLPPPPYLSPHYLCFPPPALTSLHFLLCHHQHLHRGLQSVFSTSSSNGHVSYLSNYSHNSSDDDYGDYDYGNPDPEHCNGCLHSHGILCFALVIMAAFLVTFFLFAQHGSRGGSVRQS